VYSESLALRVTSSAFESSAGAPQAAQLLQLQSLLRRQIVDDSQVSGLVHLLNGWRWRTRAMRGGRALETLYKSVSFLPCTNRFP
jgi:hypothetical protein